MSGTSGLPPIPLYLTYAGNETKYAAASIAADPQSAALLAYFKKVAPSITTPDALLKNYKALTVVLNAFGLGNKIGQTGILRKLLTQDPTQKTSLANTIGNAKFLAFARALSFSSASPFATAAGIAKVATAYTTGTFEQSADKQAPGLADALYFTRQAASLKTITKVQADPDALKVVLTGLGEPVKDFDQLDFSQQTAILTNKLKLSNLQSPTYVKQVAEQYLIAQQSTAATGPASGSVGSLFSDTTDTSGDALLGILDPSASADGSDSDGSGANTLALFA